MPRTQLPNLCRGFWAPAWSGAAAAARPETSKKPLVSSGSGVALPPRFARARPQVIQRRYLYRVPYSHCTRTKEPDLPHRPHRTPAQKKQQYETRPFFSTRAPSTRRLDRRTYEPPLTRTPSATGNEGRHLRRRPSASSCSQTIPSNLDQPATATIGPENPNQLTRFTILACPTPCRLSENDSLVSPNRAVSQMTHG